MRESPSIKTARVRLVALDAGTARVIATGQHGGPDWAPDFPDDGDMVVAGLFARSSGTPGRPTVDPAEAPWRQPWLVLHEDLVVGTVGFKAAPDQGRVEVGYGLVPSVRGRGLATEAVRGLIAAAAERGVTEVVAETLVDNWASRRVLEKLGFVRTGGYTSEEGELITWRLPVSAAAENAARQ
jgi:ribosomal protein S18 acetylase RimI-like enzyme